MGRRRGRAEMDGTTQPLPVQDCLPPVPACAEQSGEQAGGGNGNIQRAGVLSPGSDTFSEDAKVVNDAEEIHFDNRLHDETATYVSPLMYFATEDCAIFNPNDHHLPEYGGLPHSPVDDDVAGSPLGAKKEVSAKAAQRPSRAWALVNSSFSKRSPRWVRFGILLLISLVPFGSHFVKNSFSSLEVYFLEDRRLDFNGTKYGALMSAQSFPNIFMPFVGGLVLDSQGHRRGVLLFLFVALLGQTIFTLGMMNATFWVALMGEMLHGAGSGTVIVAQRAVVSKYFYDKELTFALGVTVAVACISKTVAKASVAPLAEAFGGYMVALWYVVLWQLLSVMAGAIYGSVSESAQARVGLEDAPEVGHASFVPRNILLTLRRSTLAFWLLVVLHTLFICVYHLFANFSGHFMVENYNMSPVAAGYITSLMPLIVVFCAPVAGLVLDHFGQQLWVMLAANCITVGAYLILMRQASNPLIGIVLLALCESFVPTILLSALPLTVDRSVYGVAFGFSEVLQALGLLMGNVYMGYVRDETQSYTADLYAVMGLCGVCILLIVVLLIWDWRNGGRLNKPRARYGYTSLPA